MFTETPEVEVKEFRESTLTLKEEIKDLMISKECLDPSQTLEILSDLPDDEIINDQFDFIKALKYAVLPKQKNYIPEERIQSLTVEGLISFLYLNHIGVKMNDVMKERDFCEPIEKVIPIINLLDEFKISLTNALRFHPELFDKNSIECFNYLNTQKKTDPISEDTRTYIDKLQYDDSFAKLDNNVQDHLFKALFETKISLHSENTLSPYRKILTDILSRHNKKLVHFWIHKSYTPDANQKDLEDALMVGTRGLLLAIDKFDPRIGIKFSTYAAFWIRLEIKRQKGHMENTISISDRELDHLVKLNYAIEREYQDKHTSKISISHVILQLKEDFDDITPNTLQKAYETQGTEVMTVDNRAEDRRLHDHAEPLETQALNHISMEEIYTLAQQELSPREFEIFSLLYPTNIEVEPKTQEEIGEIYGFTRSNAGLILKTIRKKLIPVLTPWFEEYKQI